jgi:hypothetical protein
MLTFTHSIGPDVRITFSEKPDVRIRDMLKANGFRWSPANGHWWRRRIEGTADFLAALERKIGPRRPDGACWDCQSPEGYFRPHAAATPVYCDQCHAERQKGNGSLGTHDGAYREPDRFDMEHEDRCRDACGL